MLNVHPSLLPRWRGAAPGGAGDHGRRRARPACRSCASTAGSTAGPVCLAEAEPIHARRHVRHARAATRSSSAASCSSATLDERPPFVEQDETRVDLRREDRARGPHARPRAPAARARADRARAASAHRRARSRCPDGSLRSRVRAAAPRAGGRARLGAARRAARRRAHRWPMRTTCAATAAGCPMARPPTCAAGVRSATPARRAHRVVRRVFEEGAYADRALHGEAAGLDRRERAFAMRLAYGTVQRKDTLDHVIDAARRPADRSSTRRRSPRCGSASTSCVPRRRRRPRRGRPSRSSSRRARRTGHLVNAVLRRAARERGRAALPTTRPEGARCATRTRRGSSGCGGSVRPRRRPRAPGRRQRARRDAVRVNTLVTARRRSPSCARPRRCPRRWSSRARVDLCRLARLARGPRHAAQSRASMLVAPHARPAARRARARPLRGARRQDDAPRRADGRRGARWSRSSATRGGRRHCARRARGCTPAASRVGSATRATHTGEGRVRPRARRPAVLRAGDAASAPRPALARVARGGRASWPAEQDAILAAARAP